jgi:3-hydroxyisobutyrate dehydrogenase-like beta-hydroxyacid dehydrogenase
MFDCIGFLGVGMMGNPMSKRLVEAGYEVIAYDIDQTALNRVKGFGANVAESPKEVSEKGNPVITMLPDSNAVESAVLGSDGLIHGGKEGDILIDMTTAYPMSTIKIAAEIAKKGMLMLDAPVSGGVIGAERGSLSIMVGGELTALEDCRPILQVLGTNIFHMGQVGSGHIMKAVNNFLSACSVIATSEALSLAIKAGLDPVKVINVLQVSSGRNYATDFKFPRFVLTRSFNDGFRVELLNKDLDILTRLARDLRVPMFTANIVQQIVGLAMSKGYAEMDHTSIAKLIEEYAGVEIKGSLE